MNLVIFCIGLMIKIGAKKHKKLFKHRNFKRFV